MSGWTARGTRLTIQKSKPSPNFFRRHIGGALGIVLTAFIADATLVALCAHTRHRSQSAAIVAEYLTRTAAINSTFAWPTSCKGPDVIFGGGAEQFIAGQGSPNGTVYYKAFPAQGHNVSNNTQLQASENDSKTLDIFCSHWQPWLDRNVLKDNLKDQNNSPTDDCTDTVDQPGLKEMTLKVIDILQTRNKNDEGWFMISDAASIDKMMHILDYDRALGDLLELDDTIRAFIAHSFHLDFEKIEEYENTLIVVTADHGHGFDVFGSADTKCPAAQKTDHTKRDTVDTYVNSGLNGYTVTSLPTNDTIFSGSEGPSFSVQWNLMYSYAASPGWLGANPDRCEPYSLNTNGPRTPAISGLSGYVVNPAEHIDGFNVSGTLPTLDGQGVRSLQDVSVFANGPGSEAFRGVYNNVNIFFKIADALALGRT